LPAHIREDPFRTLIGCLLSTRTLDERTDIAFAALFSRYPTLESLLDANPEVVRELIKPVNFYATKAKRVLEAASYISKVHGGKVPRSRKLLLEVPGIGPKCADIILNYSFRKTTVAVDTHVEVVSKRLGVCSPEDSYDIAKNKIESLATKRYLGRINDILVCFGKEFCRKRGPRCGTCPVFKYCEWPEKYKVAKRDSETSRI
jgi:endonuclease-3